LVAVIAYSGLGPESSTDQADPGARRYPKLEDVTPSPPRYTYADSCRFWTVISVPVCKPFGVSLVAVELLKVTIACVVAIIYSPYIF
jgi:hypothetical protein